MTEDDRVLAEAAIERQCAIVGIRRDDVGYHNWQSIFKTIVDAETIAEIERISVRDSTDKAEVTSPSSSLLTTATAADAAMMDMNDDDYDSLG
jgi:hypothetical protein